MITYVNNYKEFYIGKYEKIINNAYSDILSYKNDINRDELMIYHLNRYKKGIFNKINTKFNTIIYGDINNVYLDINQIDVSDVVNSGFKSTIKDLGFPNQYDFNYIDLFNDDINDEIRLFLFTSEELNKISFHTDNKIITSLKNKT